MNYDIENGQQVIDALDPAGKAPNVALWAKLPDYENWRLVLASDQLEQSSPFSGYSEINEAIEKAGIPMHRQPTILLRPMDNPFIQELRGLFSAAGDTRGMRLGGQRFGDKYLEDAFVYRIR
ncbi:MAG: hypothetical protein ABR987_01575 [Terracidiphilus sp.]